MSFRPSVYSSYGQTIEPSSTGVSTLKVAGQAASTTATTLTVLGTGAATVPVGGWIVAGALGIAAGTVILVNEIKNGKKNKAAAVKWAKQIGLPDPEEAAAFIVKVATKDKKWRDNELAQQRRQIKRKKGRRVTEGRTRRMERDKWKRDVLVAYKRYLKTGSVTGKPSSAQTFQPIQAASRGSATGRRRQIPQTRGGGFVPSSAAAPAGAAGLSPGAIAAIAVVSVLVIGGVVYGTQKGG
jgi:hypothetical protein